MGEMMNILRRAEHPERPDARFYIDAMFDDFTELHGDRLYGDDPSLIGGIARLDGRPVTILAQLRGHTLEQRIRCNFSMTMPEGYRKAARLMRQAEKFHRPVVCMVDTMGAFPGREAEERGQSAAIASCLSTMLGLRTSIISLLIGNGGSGGALALCLADRVAIQRNALLSVISPKACANILWKDSSRSLEAARMLRMSANDLMQLGIVDAILPEPGEGAHADPAGAAKFMREYVIHSLESLSRIPVRRLVHGRNARYRKVGSAYVLRNPDTALKRCAKAE